MLLVFRCYLEGTLRRLVFLSTLVLAGVLLVASVAYARTINCTGSGPCVGTARHDLMRGGTGDDGMDGNDRMLGGTGQDMLKGRDDADTINGDDGDDRAKGGGRDTVNGGAGDDIIRGGSHGGTNDGVHALDCGGGRDTVYFVQGQDTVTNCEIFNPPE